MPPQEHLYIITASNEDAKEHVRKSIANPVDPAICAAHFPTDVLDEVRRKSTDGNFYAWGARPGKRNEPNWNALQQGDYVFLYQDGVYILDTKWKRLNQDRDTTRDKYGISQEDMYQMFAYGQRYLNGVGDLFLIYPKTKDFSRTLPMFQFSNDLRLWAVAFDLERGAVVEEGLPEHLKGVVGLAPWPNTVH